MRHVTFRRADLLRLGEHPDTYDVVESVGVLHHLADPWAGWRVLRGKVHPGGLMRIGVYAERSRADIDLLGLQHLLPTAPPLYRARFPDDPAQRDLDRWDALEAEHPRLFTGMYVVWARARR